MADNRTKRITIDAAIQARVATDPFGALAQMVMAAFGVSLDQIVAAIQRMIDDKDEVMIALCVDAAIQVRGNVTFVTSNVSGGIVRAKYPVFLITSTRDTGDDFNFSALHVAGHAICIAAGSKLAAKILAKVGNCITGEKFPDTQSGKINAELKATWSSIDIAAYEDWVSKLSADQKKWLADTGESIPERARAAKPATGGSPPSRPAPPSKAS